MNFAWPLILLMLALPALLLAWEISRGAAPGVGGRPQILRADAGAHSIRLAGTTASPVSSAGRTGPRFWFAAGLALSIVALARPQWGRIDEPVFDQSREVLIALDLSRSMLTPDVKPSRLDRSKLLIQSLLDRLVGERVGLALFSGTSFLQSPLSADYEILREFLPSLNPDYMPEGGTNYGALIETAASAFSTGPGADRYLIILSDGGATDDDWRSHIKSLTSRGIRVIGLGVGSAKGALIPDGTGGFLKDDTGAVVMSKLESDTLRELANKTGGVYKDANDWVDLAQLLKATVETGKKGHFVEQNSIRYAERFQWLLAPAMVCLLMSFWREFPVRPKPRDLRPEAVGRRTGPPVSGTKSAVGALCILLLGGVHESKAIPPVFAALTPSNLAAPSVSGPGTAQSATAPAPAASPAAPPPPSSGSLLGRIVGRLSGQEQTGAHDWSEMAGQTITWGQEILTGHQAVPEGPVRDALNAVDQGAALDPKAADWPTLRSKLEDLLKKSEDQKQNQQKQDQQKQDQQDKDQQKQQNQDQKSSNSGNAPKNSQQNQKQGESGSQQNPQPDQKSSPQSPQSQPESAFGDMNGKPQQKAQPPSENQQVGGRQENKRPDPAQADPSLATPLQKLDQLRDDDAPAELYQMIENNEPHAPEKKGKNW